jgi:hypothetical protein
MADDLAFVRFKGALTLGVQRRNLGKGVGPALGDGIAKELKDIVVFQSFIPMDRTVFHLAIGTQIQPTTADHCHKPYHDTLPQALIGSNSLN